MKKKTDKQKKLPKVICNNVKGCPFYNHPKHECYHAKIHEVVEGEFEDCNDEKDLLCRGKCVKVKKQK